MRRSPCGAAASAPPGRRTARTVELASLNPEHEDRLLNLGEVAWMARVMWVRQ